MKRFGRVSRLVFMCSGDGDMKKRSCRYEKTTAITRMPRKSCESAGIYAIVEKLSASLGLNNIRTQYAFNTVPFSPWVEDAQGKVGGCGRTKDAAS